jgi:uncharacterized glyoxalase superfamily protein PhnB
MNASMPPGDVIPVLAYPDVREAVDWLCRAFGFRERLRIGDHRAQLSVGGGSVIVTATPAVASVARPPEDTLTHSIMVCVADVNAHYERAHRLGARIISPPADYPYGERQYTVEDPGGHRWTFSQTIAEVDPQVWGGILVELA